MLVAFAFVLGAVIGSFLNVVIYRLPKGESIVHPPSHCPACGHRLGPVDMVPILSWIAFRGRCRYCGAPVSARYPLVEGLTGALFALAAWLHPVPDAGLVLAWTLAALLVALAFIDIDHYILPDSLTYGGLALGLVGAAVWGFPVSWDAAWQGALAAAGLLALIGGYANLVLRRGASGRPGFPVGLEHVYLAAAVGAWAGWGWGLAAAAAAVALNLVLGRPLPLHDALTLGAALLGVVVASYGALPLDVLESVWNLLLAAGAVALAGGLYWALQPEEEEDEEDEEPVAMGFGDVKLAGMLGAWLGFGPFLVALAVAVFAGALFGLLFRRRKLPFGPYLALGGWIALWWGADWVRAYLAYLGLS
ncbi:prepilin peptidase [Oceanithermus sp.]|uniref:prepilin peptidase n=2 Tax=Oceanithermus sp. TaxID=2268145 RepID=UPI0025E542F5|nr:prepilin peptidase [Oceanithermus sp.]